jgi:uncharacterized membrane protein
VKSQIAPTTGEEKPKRIISIDVLRGIIIAIMLLDHAREFFSWYKFSPTDLSQTHPALFLTRWVTHFCAPVFVFLAGTSAFLYHVSRNRSVEKTSFFLWSRGLFLLFLELTAVRFMASFNFNYFDNSANICQVIWAIGWSMIFLSFLVRLSTGWIVLIGGSLVLFHNLFDGIGPSIPSSWQWLYILLHQRGTLPILPGIEFQMIYPLIPWIGLIALGYVFGHAVILAQSKKKRVLWWLGFGMVLVFLFLRSANLYGDPVPWSHQKTWWLTVFSFFNVSKYPPSLQYLLITLGPSLLLLSFFSENERPVTKFFRAFGAVPMFFYLVHIFLLHAMAIGFAWLRYGNFPGWMFSGNPIFNMPVYPNGPPDYGYSLAVVYAVWLAVLLTLYPLCSWYMKFKKTHNYAWLSYL